MKPNIKKLLIFLAIPLAVGGLSALLSGSGFSQYGSLNRPPLSPPAWVFPVVWSILYLLMGYSAYRVYTSDCNSRPGLIAFGVQLFFNFLWTPVFFGLQWRLTAFFILVILWVAIFVTMRLFSKCDQLAADLLLPYLLWVCFAGYLNLGAFLLN